MIIAKLVIIFLLVMFLVSKKQPIYIAVTAGAAATWILYGIGITDGLGYIVKACTSWSTLQLIVVMAVVISISLGLSVFFKVEKVMVYGNKAYSAWAVQEASGIEGGEKLLTFGNIRACGKIKASLPYVKTVRIGINLPDTVNIYLTEYDVVYAIQDQNSGWWLMTSDGRVIQQTDSGTASSYTKVLGVKLDNPAEGQQAVAEVVLNRIAADDFPNNLKNVIYAPGQFRSAAYLDEAEPYQAQYDAIERAIYGPYILPEDVVHFATFRTNNNVWGQIGGHIFCHQW